MRQKFDGYERDDETGLDFAQARYFSSFQGRFTSVDPLHSSAILDDPQSWNRYSFVGNRPLIYIDPTGLQWGRSTETGEYKWFGDTGGVVPDGWEKVSIGTEYGSVNGRVVLQAGGNWDYVRPPQAGINVFRDSELGWTTVKFIAFPWMIGAATGGGGPTAGAAVAINIYEQESQGPLILGTQPVAPEGLIDPNQVHFSQESVRPTFSDGRTIDDTANGLRSGSVKASDVPPIRLVEKDGVLYTLDNRRLEAFRRAGVQVRYRMATPAEAAKEGWKFTTRNGGTSIRIRSK